jgi:putative beta-lysine N-acetyltransferase
VIKEIRTDTVFVQLVEDRFNKRIRIDDYSGDLENVIQIIRQHRSDWTEKTIVKARAKDLVQFIAHNFIHEAHIPGYFLGKDMAFMVQYHTPDRLFNNKATFEKMIIDQILSSDQSSSIIETKEVKVAGVKDIPRLASLYSKTLKIYPTPISDPDHIADTMEKGTIYVYMEENELLVSAASAEINRTYKNAELTDCATLEHVQGKGHIKKLLKRLEEILENQDITCLYTIARSESVAMNKAFYQLGYTYGGRLTNNCMIYSGLEDMNVWYKFTK